MRARRTRLADRLTPPRSVAEYAQALANLIVAVSAVFAVGQYVESRRAARVDRTLEMLERFEGETYAGARQFADRALGDVRAQLHSSLSPAARAVLPPGQEAELAERLTRIRVYGQGQSGTLPSELGQVTGFFNSLQTCIEQRVCDRSTAHGLFDTYASTFWEGYAAIIEHERQDARPSFASGLERFVRQAKATQ